MSTYFLAIKMGSSMTTIYKQGEGFILTEPSLVAVNLKYNEKQIVAVGNDAKKLIGKSSDSGISVVSPISEGIINDTSLASEMIKHFIAKVCPKRLFKPTIRALVCVPLGISLAERLTFERTCYAAGISDCVLIPSVVCSAIGVGINISSSQAHMVVGIGAGCTDIAVLGENMLINGVNIGIGGSNIDKAIIQQIYNNFNLIISDEMAEKVKKDIGSLYINDLNSINITGKDGVSGESKEIVVTAVDVYPAVEHYYAKVIESIQGLLAICSPEVSSDIAKSGIALVGGDSKVVGIEKYFKTKLNINVKSYIDAEDLEMVGASKLLDNPQTLKHILVNI